MQQVINYILGIGGILGGIITAYKMISKPNIAQDQRLIKVEGEVKYNRTGIAELKKKSDKIDSKLDKIMNNHLKHLEMAIVKLETTVEGLSKRIK